MAVTISRSYRGIGGKDLNKTLHICSTRHPHQVQHYIRACRSMSGKPYYHQNKNIGIRCRLKQLFGTTGLCLTDYDEEPAFHGHFQMNISLFPTLALRPRQHPGIFATASLSPCGKVIEKLWMSFLTRLVNNPGNWSLLLMQKRCPDVLGLQPHPWSLVPVLSELRHHLASPWARLG